MGVSSAVLDQCVRRRLCHCQWQQAPGVLFYFIQVTVIGLYFNGAGLIIEAGDLENFTSVRSHIPLTDYRFPDFRIHGASPLSLSWTFVQRELLASDAI